MPNQIAAGTFAFAIIPGEHQSKFIFLHAHQLCEEPIAYNNLTWYFLLSKIIQKIK